jgi:peptide/nickel transport system substrate-binding protein
MQGARVSESERRGLSRRALLNRSLAFSAGTLLLAACNSIGGPWSRGPVAPAVTPSPDVNPVPGGTLRISQPSDILPALVPHGVSPSNSALTNLVHDTLVRYDTQLQVQPALATSWEWSSDFLRLTMKLRQGVKFHTGRPFTSADAKFNIERVRDPSVGSQWLNYATDMQVDAPDPLTLIIRFTTPSRSSFDALTALFMADSQTLGQTTTGGGFVGTGPFRFKEWVQGDHVTLVRNTDYWQPDKPYLDQVDVMIRPDSAAAVIGLESGQLDWVIGVPGQDAQRLQNDAAFQVLLNGNGSSFYYVGLDVSVAALADKRVRQAVAFAVDRQRMVERVLYRFGRPASTLWPRQSPAYDADLDNSVSYDLARARDLLLAANWDQDTVVPLTLSSAGAAVTRPMAEILQHDLASIGVTLELRVLDAADAGTLLRKAQFGGAWLATMNFMNLSPPTLYASAFPVRMPNASNFESPRYTELIDLSRRETDDRKLQVTMRELTQMTLDEAFVVPIAEAASLNLGTEVARATLKHIAFDDWGWPAYQDIWLEH